MPWGAAAHTHTHTFNCMAEHRDGIYRMMIDRSLIEHLIIVGTAAGKPKMKEGGDENHGSIQFSHGENNLLVQICAPKLRYVRLCKTDELRQYDHHNASRT